MALLLTGGEADRCLSRGTLSDTRLNAISRRRAKSDESVEASIRRGESRRLAIAIRAAGHGLKQNKKQLGAMVDGLAPRLQEKVGVGPVSATQAIVSWSHAGRCRVRRAGWRQPHPGK